MPPRESVVVFTDGERGRRSVELPVRAAIPVLTRARATAAEQQHPSVALLAGSALLALQVVASGRFEPSADGDSWRTGRLHPHDQERVLRLAQARRPAELDDAGAERVVRAMLEAVVDTLPRATPAASSLTAAPVPRPRDAAGARPDFQERLAARLRRHRADPAEAAEAGGTPDELPQLVRISLRVEAAEEDLRLGGVRVVLQVHDERDPLHVCDAAELFAETGSEEPGGHGFGPRARTHAAIALRAAAEAWPVLERMLELRVPDELSLDGDEVAGLLEHGVGALRERGVDVLWPRSLGRDLTASAVLERRPSPGGPRPTSGVREEPLQDPLLGTEAIFGFTWQLALHGEPLTQTEMDQLAAAASPVLKLRGSWTVVDPALARKARKRLLRTVTPAQAVAAALTGVVEVGPSAEAEEVPVVVGASVLRVREQLLAAATREPVPPPAALRAELREYQRHGLTWLADLTALGLGACLADDMGLGKTVTVIALHLHRAELARAEGGEPGPTLVVCPASLLGNWEAEVEKFAPGTPVRRFHGSARDLAGVGEGSGGFVLTTYGTMRRDVEALAQVPWDLVVADEAQHVKNPRASTARMLRRIPSRARVALTGTPVENELVELWAILDWCIPGLLGSRNAFRKAWAQPIESGKEPAKAAQFAELVGPFLLRRRKSDPGIAPELPPKTETDHLLGLTREQVVLYEAFVRDTMERIERADEDARRGMVLALLTGLKQICNHPAQFLRQSGAVRLRGRSEKLELLDELLATILAEDGAVLVFTQYVAMARLLVDHLAAAGVPHQLLHGGTPVREREQMVARFQAGEVPVFLLSLKAGGTGLNLTRADHVVHVDRWWNPAVEEQATDRAYRIGQTRPVQVHRLVTRGTVEERVAQLLARKQALADAVLGRGEAALTELSNEELRDLVALRPSARPSARPGSGESG
ncbi:DEAD/DEAH box helicase [Nocardioides nanhaiensis]